MSTDTIHIFTAEMQEATNFESDGMTFTCKPNSLRPCCRCRRMRRAKNLTVQAFYDGARFWCKDQHCNNKS